MYEHDNSIFRRNQPVSLGRCPNSDDWHHADIAECLAMPLGTLLADEAGHYCPACDYRPQLAGGDHRQSSRTS
jgi:hypothetical protein